MNFVKNIIKPLCLTAVMIATTACGPESYEQPSEDTTSDSLLAFKKYSTPKKITSSKKGILKRNFAIVRGTVHATNCIDGNLVQMISDQGSKYDVYTKTRAQCDQFAPCDSILAYGTQAGLKISSAVARKTGQNTIDLIGRVTYQNCTDREPVLVRGTCGRAAGSSYTVYYADAIDNCRAEARGTVLVKGDINHLDRVVQNGEFTHLR